MAIANVKQIEMNGAAGGVGGYGPSMACAGVMPSLAPLLASAYSLGR